MLLRLGGCFARITCDGEREREMRTQVCDNGGREALPREAGERERATAPGQILYSDFLQWRARERDEQLVRAES